VTNSTFRGGSNDRGAIYVASGTLSLTNSTVTGNAGLRGGGIQNLSSMSVMRSLISGNTAYGLASGIYNAGGAALDLSTVSWGTGSGIWNDSDAEFWIRPPWNR